MPASTAPQSASPHLAAVPAPFSLIAPERLWELYAAMLRCRAVARRAAELVDAGLPAHRLRDALGREAVYAGVLVCLQPADLLFAMPEDTLAGLLHGLSLANLFAPLAPAPARRKKNQPQAAPKEDVLPFAPSAAAQLSLANGAAFALKPQPENPLAVALCGSGSAPGQAWRQALDFAGAHTLPILFVCHVQARNAAAFAKAQARLDRLFSFAQAARVPAIAVDAQDAVAVYRVASESISRARLRRGPTLIACLAHPTTSARGSKTQEGLHAESAETLHAMETCLTRKSLFDPARKAQIVDAFARQLDRATKELLRRRP